MKKLLALMLVGGLLAGCGASDCRAPKDAPMNGAESPELATWYVSGENEDVASMGKNLMPALESPEDVEPMDAADIFSVRPPADMVPPQNAPATETEPLYAVFTAIQGAQYAADGTELLQYKLYTPSFSTGDTGTDGFLSDAWEQFYGETCQPELTALYAQADTVYAATLREPDATSFYTYSYHLTSQVHRLDSQVLSLTVSISTYCGGAHPETVQYGMVYDLEKCRRLSLTDVLKPETDGVFWETVVQSLNGQLQTLGEVSGRMAPADQSEALGFGAVARNYQDFHWYLGENALMIYFNACEIASYAAGIVTVELPYEMLAEILRPEYVPQTRTEGQGSLILGANDPAGFSITLEYHSQTGGPANAWCITTPDGAGDLRVYPASGWLSPDNPVVENMVLAVSALAPGQQIRLIGDCASGAGFLLSCADGGGEVRQYRLDAEGMCEVFVKSVK